MTPLLKLCVTSIHIHYNPFTVTEVCVNNNFHAVYFLLHAENSLARQQRLLVLWC